MAMPESPQNNSPVASEIHKEDMNIVIAGHVDHGKSTIAGRLLADTGSLPDGKLEFVKETCRRNAKPFEYAFLLDALKDERAQGITIDAARCFFQTAKRRYIIIDAPGHIEFLKNMITGAARAEAALLVIDAGEGIRENSRRHGYMLSLLGIKQITVLINKMDLVNYDQEIYQGIKNDYASFLQEISLIPDMFIPVSGMTGDNIAQHSPNMPWYDGSTVLEALDQFQTGKLPEDKPFRMPVQGVYKFTQNGDNRRIIAGTLITGRVKTGDEVIFYPSGKTSRVKTIEAFNESPKTTAQAGSAVGFTLHEQIYLTRGEVATLASEPKPLITSRIKANIFWLGKNPFEKQKEYILKIGTARVPVRLESIIDTLDASSLEKTKKDVVNRHDVAECILKMSKDIVFDHPGDIFLNSRFVIVDDYEIAGGGLALEALEDEHSWLRSKVHLRNLKWEPSDITDEDRAERYNQKAILLLITGAPETKRKQCAKHLEKLLFNDGKYIYFLGIGNILYGLDADIKLTETDNKEEHFRRLAEVANILLDAGLILLVTARELRQEDLELLKMSVNPDRIKTVWLGEEVTTDLDYNLHISHTELPETVASKIKKFLQKSGVIFKPY